MSRTGTRLRSTAAFGAAVTTLAAVAGATPVSAARTAEIAPASATAASPYLGEITTVKYGPFNLAPAPLGNMPNQNRFLPDLAKPCEDCFITGVVPKLVYADGTRADMTSGVMLHHLVIADTSRPDATCDRTDGIGAIGERFFASGDERTPIAMPKGYGYHVKAGNWVGIVELMNHSPLPRAVYFTADVYHVPASTKGMTPITPVWMDVANCFDSQYGVPAGRSNTKWDWTSTLTGKIVAAAGHVHAGGVGTVLTNTTTGKRICSSEAGYGTEDLANMVTSMSSCSWDSLGTVRAGEKLQIESLYDTPAAMKGVMGIMLLAVAETKNLKGGTKAPASMRATPDTKVPAGVADDHAALPGIGGHGH